MTPHIVKSAEETRKLQLELQSHEASAIDGFLQAYAATCGIWGGYHSSVEFVLTEVGERSMTVDLYAKVGKIKFSMGLSAQYKR